MATKRRNSAISEHNCSIENSEVPSSADIQVVAVVVDNEGTRDVPCQDCQTDTPKFTHGPPTPYSDVNLMMAMTSSENGSTASATGQAMCIETASVPANVAPAYSACACSAKRINRVIGTYFSKWKGIPGKKSPPLPHWREYIAALVGAFAGIGIVAALNFNFAAVSDSALVMLVASFGATAVLLYATPGVPLAQPRNVIIGHAMSALIGVILRYLILDLACDERCPSVASAVAVTCAILVMMATGTVHPPGGATALIAVVGDESVKRLGFLFVLVPATVGAVIMVLVALVVNNAFQGRQYPQYWL